MQLNEYIVNGRKLPSEDVKNPQLYTMRVFAPNAIVAKSCFWWVIIFCVWSSEGHLCHSLFLVQLVKTLGALWSFWWAGGWNELLMIASMYQLISTSWVWNESLFLQLLVSSFFFVYEEIFLCRVKALKANHRYKADLKKFLCILFWTQSVMLGSIFDR